MQSTYLFCVMCRLRRKVDVCVFSPTLFPLSSSPSVPVSPIVAYPSSPSVFPLFFSPLIFFPPSLFKLIRPFFRGCELASCSCSGYSAAPTQRGGLRRWQAQDDHNPNTHIGTHRGGGRQKKNPPQKNQKNNNCKKGKERRSD